MQGPEHQSQDFFQDCAINAAQTEFRLRLQWHVGRQVGDCGVAPVQIHAASIDARDASTVKRDIVLLGVSQIQKPDSVFLATKQRRTFTFV